MSRTCPHCKLINPDTTMRCDCGYDFNEGIIKHSHLLASERLKAASKFQELVKIHGGAEAAFKAIGKRNLIQGAAWCLAGSLLMTISYLLATEEANRTGEGRYFIWTAPIWIGVFQFGRGLKQYFGRH